MKHQIRVFVTMQEKTIYDWANCQPQNKKKSKSNLSRSSTVASMLQLNCNVLTMIQYVHCLRNVHNQSTAIYRQIIRVDNEVEYFCDNIIYHYPISVCIFLEIQCTKSSMELVWKYERLSFIPFLKFSIPFHSGIFHIPYRNFRFIPFHFPFHSIPCPASYLSSQLGKWYSNAFISEVEGLNFKFCAGQIGHSAGNGSPLSTTLF